MADLVNKYTALSFLDKIEKDAELKKGTEEFMNTPTVKLRKLNAAKDDGRDKCMLHVLTQVCKNSIPDLDGVNPETPDLNSIVSSFIQKRSNGKGVGFYVREALKRRNGHCMERVVHAIDSIMDEMYLEKELNPDNIDPNNLEFDITPEVEDKLTAVIRDNQLDDLSDVIRNNVKADAIEEVIAAKKEKDDRMQLEDELMNDDSITSESAISEALAARGLMDTKFYTPSLFEAVMIKSFNESASNTSSETSQIISSIPCPTSSSCVNNIPKDMFAGHLEGSRSEVINTAARISTEHLLNQYMNTYDVYRSKINPIDMNYVISAFKNGIGCSDMGNQIVCVMDIRSYHEHIMNAATTVAKNLQTFPATVSTAVPCERIMDVSLKDLPEMAEYALSVIAGLVSNPDAETFIKKYIPTIISIANMRNSVDEIDNLFHEALKIPLLDIDKMNSCINFLQQFVQYAGKVNDVCCGTSVKNKAFENAVYEYTILNTVKALRLESFSLDDIKNLSIEYARTI